jgi:hypothetical protein
VVSHDNLLEIRIKAQMDVACEADS